MLNAANYFFIPSKLKNITRIIFQVSRKAFYLGCSFISSSCWSQRQPFTQCCFGRWVNALQKDTNFLFVSVGSDAIWLGVLRYSYSVNLETGQQKRKRNK